MDLVEYKIAKMMHWTNKVQPLLNDLKQAENAWKEAKAIESKYIENESDLIDNILQAEYHFNKELKQFKKKFNRTNEPK